MIQRVLWGIALFCCFTSLCTADGFSLKEGQYAIFQTSAGGFVVKMNPQSDGSAIENFVLLATGKKEWTQPVTRIQKNTPLYDNTDLYYVNPGEEIRGGDPLNRGTGGPGYSLPLKDSDLVPLTAGGLLCAETGAGICHGSRFRILISPKEEKGIVMGKVIQGMDNLIEISRRPSAKDGRPFDPVKVLSLSIIDVPAGYHALGSFVEENGARVVDINRSFVMNVETTSSLSVTPVPVQIKDEKKTVRVIKSEKESAEEKGTEKKTDSKKNAGKSGNVGQKRQTQQRRSVNPEPVQQQPRKKKLLFWRN